MQGESSRDPAEKELPPFLCHGEDPQWILTAPFEKDIVKMASACLDSGLESMYCILLPPCVSSLTGDSIFSPDIFITEKSPLMQYLTLGQ